jgi:hypothetical protein
MRFDEVKIGDFFAESYIDQSIHVFQKVSISTAERWSVQDGRLIQHRAITRDAGRVRFGKSNRVWLME